jgi:hypothetical protein
MLKTLTVKLSKIQIQTQIQNCEAVKNDQNTLKRWGESIKNTFFSKHHFISRFKLINSHKIKPIGFFTN